MKNTSSVTSAKEPMLGSSMWILNVAYLNAAQ